MPPNKRDDWSFKLDQKEADKKARRRKAVRPNTPAPKKSVKLKLDKQVRVKKPRAEYLQEDHGEENMAQAAPEDIWRFCAGLFDVSLVVLLPFILQSYYLEHLQSSFGSLFSDMASGLTTWAPVMEKFITSDFIAVIFASFCLYTIFDFFFMVLTGRSLGQLFFGIRVVGEDFQSLSLSKIFWREYAAKAISILSVVGILIPFFHQDKRSLHDYLSGSYVVK